MCSWIYGLSSNSYSGVYELAADTVWRATEWLMELAAVAGSAAARDSASRSAAQSFVNVFAQDFIDLEDGRLIDSCIALNFDDAPSPLNSPPSNALVLNSEPHQWFVGGWLSSFPAA
jgi:hypothetical protein